jgi:HPt (histidine-containing phosphotransfer) domain-containing protein
VETYLSSIPENVQNLIVALNANNTDNIRFYAHKLKGSFYFIGSEEVGKSFEEIEMNCNDETKHSFIGALCASAIRGVAAATAELKDVLLQVKAPE